MMTKEMIKALEEIVQCLMGIVIEIEAIQSEMKKTKRKKKK